MPLRTHSEWKKKHKLEFIWRPTFLTGEMQSENGGIFAHKFLGHYAPSEQSGFRLANTWPALHTRQQQIHKNTQRFSEWPDYINEHVVESELAYQTTHSIFMFGDDFSHP